MKGCRDKHCGPAEKGKMAPSCHEMFLKSEGNALKLAQGCSGHV